MGRFTVTEDHIKLLAHSYWRWDTWQAYEGCVTQDPKRPYGDSDGIGNLWRILCSPDGETFWDRDEQGNIPEALENELLGIHEQMATVVQILTLSAGVGFPFGPGEYVKTRPYDALSWRPAP